MSSQKQDMPAYDYNLSPGHASGLSFGRNRKLHSFIKKRMSSPEDADDILQLTYLEAWRNRNKFDGRGQPDTWLCGIALNLIRNHFRRLQAKPLHSQLDEELHEQSTDAIDLSIECERGQLLDRTLQAMAELPHDMRRTLQVAINSDGNYQNIAELMGIPIGTVRSRLSRAREQLKRNVHGGVSP